MVTLDLTLPQARRLVCTIMRSMNKLEKLADTLPGVPARIIGWLHNDLTQVYDALPDEAKITEAGEPITGNEFRKP